MPSTFNPRDIGPDDFVVVTAPKNDNDPYYFDVPLCTTKVWVAKALKKLTYNKTTKEYHLKGWFAQNKTRNLTHPLVFDTHIDSIDFTEATLVGVYEQSDTLEFTDEDITELRKNINAIK